MRSRRRIAVLGVSLLKPAMQEIGWTPRPDDTDERKGVRAALLFSALGATGARSGDDQRRTATRGDRTRFARVVRSRLSSTHRQGRGPRRRCRVVREVSGAQQAGRRSGRALPLPVCACRLQRSRRWFDEPWITSSVRTCAARTRRCSSRRLLTNPNAQVARLGPAACTLG